MSKRKDKKKKKITKVKAIESQYEYLASEYYIKRTPELDNYAMQAHNLYNAALYTVRQAFFKHKLLSYNDLNRIFKKKVESRENMLYHAFPYVQSAQQTLKEVMAIWKAWFKALAVYRIQPYSFTGRPRIPKYLRKNERHVFYVTNQNAKVKNGYLWIPKMNFKLKLQAGIEKIQRVVFKPMSNGYKVIVPYKTNLEIKYKKDNGKYVGIDPGVDNAFALAANTGVQPLLISGGPIKSVNQYYNKRRAKLRRLQAKNHQLETIIDTKQGKKPVYGETKAQKRITDWRNEKIRQFAHKASKRIIDYALNCDANTIVIGKNTFWKQKSGMLKKTNQNFIGIPHAKMLEMVKYKANLAGIRVIYTNESYTSQTSALDNEKPCWNNGNNSRIKQGIHPSYRRIERGLFKSNDGKLINSDINGALQIIRKVFPKVTLTDGIADAVLRPIKWSPTI